MESQSEENESEKNPNLDEHCVLIFTCSYCGNKINTTENFSSSNSLSLKENFSGQSMMDDDLCPSCKHNFSKCSVCLCPIKISKKLNNECYVYCTKCHHGGHYEHYKGWFKEFNECPNSKCDCRCQDENFKNLKSDIKS